MSSPLTRNAQGQPGAMELTITGDGVTSGAFAMVPAVLLGQFVEFTIYIQFSAGVSAGKFQIQSAHDPTYTGTWANVGSTIDWAAASSEKYASVTGVFAALRIAIDTTVANGTAKVFLIAASHAP